jgi:hypothetical protein
MVKITNLILLKQLFILAVFAASLLAISSSVYGQSSLLNKPVDSQKTSSMAERIANRKNELKLNLGEAELSGIEAKCKPAQATITKIKSKDTVTIDNYYKAYEDIAGQVSGMISRLNEQGVSTAGIQTTLNLYVDSANRYLLDADKYKAALSDLETMDCQADAEGFAASLQDARNLRAKLATDSESAKVKVDDISAALIGAKDKL